MLLYDIGSPNNAQDVAHKILTKVEEPVLIEDYEISINISIGIAMYPGNGKNAESILRAADAAMYEVKKAGRHGIKFFEDGLQREINKRNSIVSALGRAVKNNEFHLVYQPKFSLSETKMVGAEVLIRWKVNGELIPPDIFIPIAEESGSIAAIGEWVLFAACKQFSRWLKKNVLEEHMRISVNVSPKQLYAGGFVEKIKAALTTSKLPPEYLEIEITETAAMEDPESVIDELESIRKLGVKIAIDDFGTGYSSLNYLKRLPIDVLKIDKSFINDIGVNEHDEAIVRAVIAIAHSLNMDVIAEGVEDLDQLIFLDKNLCDHVQGYVFSKPLSVTDFGQLLHYGNAVHDKLYRELDGARSRYDNGQKDSKMQNLY